MNPSAAPSLDLGYLGLSNAIVHRNLTPAPLVEQAIRREEGMLSDTGALVVATGVRTGRSPHDRFIVDSPAVHDSVAWGPVNRPMTQDAFDALWDKALRYLDGRELFVFDGLAGADRAHAKRIRVVNESPAQNLFIHQLLVRPTAAELEAFGQGDYTLLAAPYLLLDPAVDGTDSEAAVALDFASRRILVAGTQYSGEIKKAIFTTLNYVLPDEGVLPMHCSANSDLHSGSVAVFFGLSGTGKTTLSADPARGIIGDDEHGWSDAGVFNFEGGCYAKCIDLTEASEPEIFRAVRFGSVVENVVVDPATRTPDYADGSITDNTRAAYPIDFIPNAVESGTGRTPDVVLFLTADAFGVLPPLSRLSPEAAMYHFVTGFTSKLAGTEVGVTRPEPTFSSLFGEPFMPRPAHVYADMLGQRLHEGGTTVYLVNTGWSGGGAAEGAKRMKLAYTRAMVSAVLNGQLDDATWRHDDVFNVDVPTSLPGCPAEILDPLACWQANGRSAEEYAEAADRLASLFQQNFAEKHADLPAEIAEAGPRPRN